MSTKKNVEKFEFEYFDRDTRTMNIGTFIRVDDNVIHENAILVSPPDERYNYIGKLEGRTDCIGYFKPLKLTYRCRTETHVTVNISKNCGGGAIRDDLIYMDIP